MDEYKFYNPEAINDFSATLSVRITDTLKYIYANYSGQTNAEDLHYFNDEMCEAFFNLRNDCLEFVKAFDYYNFVHSEPFPKDLSEFGKVLKERTQQYQSLLNEDFKKVLAYSLEAEE